MDRETYLLTLQYYNDAPIHCLQKVFPESKLFKLFAQKVKDGDAKS